MYIIILNPEERLMYKAIYDEGFKGTANLEQATKFVDEREAREILQTPVMKKLYSEAIIERIKR
jgi:hypothetical protein